jgi:hypothetical protein
MRQPLIPGNVPRGTLSSLAQDSPTPCVPRGTFPAKDIHTVLLETSVYPRLWRTVHRFSTGRYASAQAAEPCHRGTLPIGFNLRQ